MAIGDKNEAQQPFWLNYAAESIYASFEKLNSANANLQKLILWAFGIFSTGGFIIILISNHITFNRFSLICFAIAFFFLTLAYYFTIKASFPSLEAINPLNQTSIETGYSNAIKAMRRHFQIANATTLIGFLFLAFGILFQFLYTKDHKECSGLVLKTGIEQKGTLYLIPVTINFEPSKPIRVLIKEDSKDTGQQKISIVDNIYYTDTSGKLATSFLIPQSTGSNRKFLVKASSILKELINREKDSSIIENSVSKFIYLNR